MFFSLCGDCEVKSFGCWSLGDSTDDLYVPTATRMVSHLIFRGEVWGCELGWRGGVVCALLLFMYIGLSLYIYCSGV